MPTHDLVSCPGALVVEWADGKQPDRLALERDSADVLAGLIGDDLRGAFADVARGKLAVVGAHFDSTELLRPGFPVFAALEGLAAAAEPGVMGIGNRDGHMPAKTLVPDPAFAGGVLRVIPWTILASGDVADELGPALENDLSGHADLGERTADHLIRAFGAPIEHARYFTRHDLMALVCVHYEHANLAALWQLLEAALLAPEREEQLVSAHGLAWRHDAHGIQARTPGQWLAANATHTGADTREHALAGIVFELRQYGALLTAHQVPFRFAAGEYDADTGCLVEPVAEVDPAWPAPRLIAHQAPGLGVIVLTVAQTRGRAARILAHAWPLTGKLDPVCARLSRRFGCPAEPERPGGIVFDSDGQLDVPADHAA